jgi:hypothetical protein
MLQVHPSGIWEKISNVERPTTTTKNTGDGS